jgi:hypothetical protein
VLSIVLATRSSAAGWRKLRIDASSEASFQESVAELQEKLTPSRQLAFARSLQDIWIVNSQLGEEQQREYTQADYFRQLDGLGYEQVVRVTDPTGKKAGQYRALYYAERAGSTPTRDPAASWVQVRQLGTTAQYPRPDAPHHGF